MNAFLAAHAWLAGDMEESVRRGEAYLSAWDAYRNGGAQREQADGAFLRGTPYWRRQMALLLAAACAGTGRASRALELFRSVPVPAMDGMMTRFALEAAAGLYVRGVTEGGTLAAALWDGVTVPEPTEEMAEERRAAFLSAGAELLEGENGGTLRPLFLPLAGRCPLGDAAARMEELQRREDPLHREAAEAAREAVPPELLQLAEQVRAILSAYPADDPAVAELKRSPLYQSLARFIENGCDGPEP